MPEPAPMVVATPADAADIIALRDRLAQWMVDHDIKQWVPGEYPVEVVAEEAARGEWFIWRDAAGLAATVRLIWHDPDFWGEDDNTPAGYVHAVMVAPEQRGREVGSRILQFCADHTLANGITLQRLDTAADNLVLRKYYAAQGFTDVREAPLPRQFHADIRIILMEKLLDPTA